VADGKRALEALVMQRAFWKGRRVFVTGHTGFKGGWLSLWLHARGAKVSGYSLAPPTTPSFFDAVRLSDAVPDPFADVRDYGTLAARMRSAAPEIVFHLAAQSLVRPSYEAPLDTYATNVMGTVHVLEAVRSLGNVRAVVVVTSDKCYENREWLWGYRETDAMGGYDPYSSSKGCAELVTSAYRSSYFTGPAATALASARAGNVIGGGDWAPDRLVPDIVRGYAAGAPVAIRNPQAVRPWQHVLEPLGGYLQLAQELCESAAHAGAWNFGPRDEDAQPVSRVVDLVSARFGRPAAQQPASGAQPHEAHYLKLDCAKARALLGWSPRTDLETAVEWTVEWYRAHANNADMRALSLEQIDRFAALGAA
jgi:CDP-glucose 4,6-dehydratase